MKSIIIIVALIYGATSGPVEDSLEEFAVGNRKFTAAMFKELIKTESGSIIASPFSAETVLALVTAGTKGQTKTELTTGLALPSTPEKTQTAFKNLLPKLKKSDDDLKLLSANKIYVAKDVQLECSFNSVATKVYDSGLENVDFAQNVKAANTINKWVEDNTNKKIRDLIKADMLSQDTKLVLVNALYFSGKWEYPFEKYATQKKKFYKTKKDSVDVDTMHQEEYFKYYENPTLKAKFLELPYKGGDIKMVIILPNEIEGLGSLEQNLEQVLQPQPLTVERVSVQLPKFTIETTIDFKPILKSLGIERLFDKRADLSGLSSTHKNLYASDVIQKAFINVTETGTEAAAATAITIGVTSAQLPPPNVYHFNVDRPFFYYIAVSTGASDQDSCGNNEFTIFAGRVNEF